MKNKEGRRTSHSYSSWTHGLRWTTHGSSGKHPWWWRSSRRWFFLPAGCREEVFLCSRSWKRAGAEQAKGMPLPKEISLLILVLVDHVVLGKTLPGQRFSSLEGYFSLQDPALSTQTHV